MELNLKNKYINLDDIKTNAIKTLIIDYNTYYKQLAEIEIEIESMNKKHNTLLNIYNEVNDKILLNRKLEYNILQEIKSIYPEIETLKDLIED